MDDRKAIGSRGEREAASYLRRKGYTILRRNYRCRRGEIDIIARKNRTVIFVEVKTGRNRSFGDPAEWVDRKKQRHLITAAQHYLQVCGRPDAHCRFDVISVLGTGDTVRIRHIEDAFWVDDTDVW
jgi:putative endonuclease